jgi:hypothetical protein
MTPLCESRPLRDGSELRLLQDSDGSIVLEHVLTEDVVRALIFEPRSAGLGGGRLILSPSEKVVVVSIYSGQSEEGFELVAVEPRLRHLLTRDYVFGEEASFAFTPSEDRLAMMYPFSCSEWWLGFDEGESVPMPGGAMRFPFGEFRLFDLHTGAETVHSLHVLLPAGWTPPEELWDSNLRVSLSGEHMTFMAPWGTEQVALPAALELDFRWRPPRRTHDSRSNPIE